MPHHQLSFFGDTLGLSPFKQSFKQALIAIFGEEDVPRSKWGLSSLSQLHPGISPKMWRGRSHIKRKAIISNLFNHTQTPIQEGWSVKKTQTQDYRGKRLTYNSHNGTDFAIPVGTTVCTAAPGEIVAILSQFNRGGLKIFIDHGNGLMTCYAHLAKSLVKLGQVVKRSDPIALSGYSGLDGMVTFPFGIPHVHFNVWLNCEPVDPFGYDNQPSLWMNGQLPIPASDSQEIFCHSNYESSKVEEAITNCKTLKTRERILAIPSLQDRGVHIQIEMNYYPTRFSHRINLYSQQHERKPILDLPFLKEEFDGVVFLDEI